MNRAEADGLGEAIAKALGSTTLMVTINSEPSSILDHAMIIKKYCKSHECIACDYCYAGECRLHDPHSWKV